MFSPTKIFVPLLALAATVAAAQQTHSVWLSDLDLTAVRQSWSYARANASMSDKPLMINSVTYTNGVGTHANSEWNIDLKQKALRLTGIVGLDDVGKDPKGKIFPAVRFIAVGDGKILWQSPVMITGRAAREMDVDLTGIHYLSLLVVMTTDVIHHDHGDWANAKLVMQDGTKPASLHELPKANEAAVVAIFKDTALKMRPPVAKPRAP